MLKQTVKCKVLGHSDGPACETCGRAMDSVQVEEAEGKVYKAHYCYYCVGKGSTCSK